MAGGAVSKAAESLAGRIRKHAAHLLQTCADRISLADGRAWAGRADAGGAAEDRRGAGRTTVSPASAGRTTAGPADVGRAAKDRGECPPGDGQPGPTAGRASVSFEEVARAWYLRPDQLPDEVDTQGLEVTEGYKPEVDTGVFTYATHAAVVAVDPATGVVEILDYVLFEDCGPAREPDDPGRPVLRRHRPGDRHRAVRGEPLRRERPAAHLDLRGLRGARSGRAALDAHRAHGVALALHPPPASRGSGKARPSPPPERWSTPSTMHCGRSTWRSTRSPPRLGGSSQRSSRRRRKYAHEEQSPRVRGLPARMNNRGPSARCGQEARAPGKIVFAAPDPLMRRRGLPDHERLGRHLTFQSAGSRSFNQPNEEATISRCLIPPSILDRLSDDSRRRWKTRRSC